jgi:hypothetical protein
MSDEMEKKAMIQRRIDYLQTNSPDVLDFMRELYNAGLIDSAIALEQVARIDVPFKSTGDEITVHYHNCALCAEPYSSKPDAPLHDCPKLKNS